MSTSPGQNLNVIGTTDWWLYQLGYPSYADGGFGDLIEDIYGFAAGNDETHVPWGMPEDYNLGQSAYDFNSLIYPDDLADDKSQLSKGSYNGHYMVINIAVQNKSNYETININGVPARNFTRMPNELSKTDALRYNIDNQYKDANGPLGRTIASRPRYTTRIKESIALVMPNSQIDYTDNHDYSKIDLLNLGKDFVGGAVGFLAKGFGAFLGKAVDLAETGGLITGIPLNPKTEVLFTNTSQREFVFEFLFSPSSVKESESLENIIRTLRFHAAPELLGTNTQTDKGPVANFVGEGTAAAKSFFFVPPSEFDITFYHQGKENTHIPRINTCVLQRIDVGYSPLGVWSTFSNGYPVSVRMMLHFREVEITHKLRVMQGF